MPPGHCQKEKKYLPFATVMRHESMKRTTSTLLLGDNKSDCHGGQSGVWVTALQVSTKLWHIVTKKFPPGGKIFDRRTLFVESISHSGIDLGFLVPRNTT